MPLEFWILLWKALFIVGVGLFAILAIVVSIGGAVDIRRLFRTLREEHARYMAAKAEDSGEAG